MHGTTAKPLVVFDYGMEENRTRGDCHGLLGVAREVARLMDFELCILDANMPAPEQTPEFYFSPAQGWQRYHPAQVPFIHAGWNETLAEKYSDDHDRNIVAHSLDPLALAEEGKFLEEKYPDLPHPLIVLNLAHPHITDIPLYVSQLEVMTKSYRARAIFLTGCWRTPREHYAEMKQGILSAFAAAASGEKTKARLYDFELADPANRNAYNPYKGLLARADHVVVLGGSRSMRSEALATGKIPHIDPQNGNDDWHHINRGIALNFRESCRAPVQDKITPINRTVSCARKIIEKYRQSRPIPARELVVP